MVSLNYHIHLKTIVIVTIFKTRKLKLGDINHMSRIILTLIPECPRSQVKSLYSGTFDDDTDDKTRAKNTRSQTWF